MTALDYTIDPRSGIAIVQPAGGLRAPHVQGVGHIVYRCHTCGDLIPKHWEVFFVDPVTGWSAYIFPIPMTSTMTTHHDWHMAATQED